MEINYLAFAIPAFFIFVFLEYLIALKKEKHKLFRYESTVSNFSIGIVERLLNLFIAGSFLSLFTHVYEHYAIFAIPNVWWVWLLLILVTDLIWYWYHRLGHQINFLWAAHIVHHQSEEFNLSVSARITTFQAFIRGIFWCGLPFLGFHPAMVVTILAVHGAYSFFTHTQVIKRTPWLEHVLITPSLHGVHHASDEKYLDKNFGDVFVFWDKLFGTFQQEEEAPTYGLTHPVRSYSFLWQHFHYYLELFEGMRRAHHLREKLKILFGNPGTLDQSIRPDLERRFLFAKPTANYRFKFRGYINLQIVICVIILTILTAFFNVVETNVKVFCVVFVGITVVNIGALLEQRKYIYYLECSRIIAVFGFVAISFELPYLTLLPLFLLILLERLCALSKIYNRYVLRYEKLSVL